MRLKAWAPVLILLGVVGAPATLHAQAAADEPLEIPDTIRIFPLPDLTLLPNTTQPFYIFEPRYREMIQDALQSDSIIGMVTLRPGFEADYEGRPPVYEMGCAGVIVAAEVLPDGRYNILLRGVQKFRIVSEDDSRPFRLAEVEGIAESGVSDPARLARLRGQIEDAVRATYPQAQLPPPGVPDVEVIDWLGLAVPLDPARRQELLRADGPAERASMLVDLLGGGAQAARWAPWRDRSENTENPRSSRARATFVAFGRTSRA